MKHIVSAAIVAACVACSSPRYAYQSMNSMGPNFDASCAVAAEKISIRVNTRGNALRDIDLVLQDGSVLKPEVVRSSSGKEVPLRMVNDLPGSGASLDTNNQPSNLVATFGRSMTEAGPRHLVLTPENGDPTSILLASIKRSQLENEFRPFGYQREDRTFPDGAIETLFVRQKSSGDERFEITQPDFDRDVAPSIQRIYQNMPATAAELEDCPEILHYLADLFERGITYQGTTEEREADASTRGPQFWSDSSRVIFYDDEGREQRSEDPLSTTTRLILAAFNAEGHAQLGEIYESAASGEMDETNFIRAEAMFKAKSLQHTVALLRDGGNGLNSEKWLEKKYGHYFRLYNSWVLEAEAGSDSEETSQAKLAGIILNSLTRNDARGQKAITYHTKLQRIYHGLVEPVEEEF